MGDDAITITIPSGPAYTFNPNGGTKHWRVKQRDTAAVAQAVRAVLGPVSALAYLCPVKLHWTVYLGKGRQKLDPDNMLSCLKPHTDSLVRHAVIVDDSTRWIPETPKVTQINWAQHREQEHIVVRIEPADRDSAE